MRHSLTIALAFVLVGAACSAPPPSGVQETGAPTGAAAQPVRGGRIVEGAFSEPKTFLPTISFDSASSDVHGWIYSSLTRLNPDTGQQEAWLAEKFGTSPDGKVVSYTLRPGLVWSDGQPFTMEDYKYSVEAVARSKKTADKTTYQDILGWQDYVDGKADEVTGIQVKDGGRTVEVTFSKVNCTAVRSIASGGRGVLPKHHFVKDWNNKTLDKDKPIDDHPLAMKPPASMGPFKFKEYRPGVQTTLVANEKYWRGQPLIDEYVIKIYADQTAIKAAILTGEVTFGSIQPADVEEVQSSGKEILNLHRVKGVASYNYIGWNAVSKRSPFLADKRVRQALTHGIDIKTIIDKLVLGWGHQVYSHIPQAHAFYDGTGLNPYPYDVAKAKQLIESAGAKMGGDGFYVWSNGQPMSMKIETNQGNKVRETIVEIAQEQYKKIGIKVEPLLESFPALTDRTKCCNPEVDGFVLGWGGLAGDPDGHWYGIFHSDQVKTGGANNAAYKNPELDKLAAQGRHGPDCSFETRKKAYAQINRILNDDAVYTFLYTGDTPFFVNKALQSVDPKPFSTLAWNIEKLWIKR